MKRLICSAAVASALLAATAIPSGANTVISVIFRQLPRLAAIRR